MSDLDRARARQAVLLSLIAEKRLTLARAWADDFRGERVRALLRVVASAQQELRDLERRFPELTKGTP